MKKTIAIIVVLVLALVVFIRLMDEESLDLDRHDSHSDIESEGEDLAAIPRRAGSATLLSEQPELEPVIEETRFGPLQMSRAVPDGVLVTCIDAISREPVPNVDIFLPNDGVNFADAMQLTLSPQVLMRDYSRSYRADESGQVRIAIPASSTIVTVFTTEYFGQARLRPEDRVLTVDVRPMPSIRARVMDEAGDPVAGVPVCWRTRTVQSNFIQFADRIREMSAADGRVLLPLPGAAAAAANESHFLSLAGVFAEQVLVPFDPASPPQDELVLTLPQTGSVEVRMLTADGSPLPPLPHVVWIERDPKTKAEGDTDWIPASILPMKGGRARIDFIGLNMKLVVGLRGDLSSEFEDQKQSFLGPTRAGEVTRLDIIIPAEPNRMIVVGRLLGPDRKPLAHTFTKLFFASENGGNLSTFEAGSIRTDAEGRFRFGTRLNMDRRGKPETFLVEIGEGREPHGRASAEIPVTALGEIHVGDLIIERDQFLVSGQVVDTSGNPIPGVKLNAKSHPVHDANPPISRKDLGGAMTDEAGAFVIYGRAAVAGGQLSIYKKGLNSLQEDFSIGSTGLRFTMESLSSFRAEIVVEDGSSLASLSFSMTATDAAEPSYYAMPPTGQIYQTLRPGSHDFRVVMNDKEKRVLYEKKSLFVPEGQEADLGRVEVLGALIAIRLKCVEQDGKAITEGSLGYRVLEAGTEHLEHAQTQVVRSRGSEVFVHQIPCDLEVSLPGYKVQRKRVETRDLTISLVSGPRAEIVVRALADFKLPENTTVSFSAIYKSPSGGVVRSDFPPGSTDCILKFSAAGNYEVSVEASVTTTGAIWRRFPRKIPRGQTIQVLDVAAPQRFELDIDLEALYEIIEKQRKGQ